MEHYIRFVGSVAGLDVGSSVLLDGIPIGRVTSVRIDPPAICPHGQEWRTPHRQSASNYLVRASRKSRPGRWQF